MYMIFDPQYDISEMEKKYEGIVKLNGMEKYSSDSAEKLSIQELKQLIQNSGFL